MMTKRTVDAEGRVRTKIEDGNGLTDEQLRAAPIAVAIVSGASSGGGGSSDGLTDEQLRAEPLQVTGAVAATCTGTVAVSNFPSSYPVTGTFWPATQPISGALTDAQLRATPIAVTGTFWPDVQAVVGAVSVSNFPSFPASFAVSNFPVSQPVTGTFWQATQPVSGSVTVSNFPSFPSSQAVTGTFWQVTQPVSGPLTDAQLRALAVAVSGTFWQATQPVSGPLTDTQIRATPLPISGAVSATCTGTVAVSNFPATQPISAATLPLPTGAALDATLTGGTARTKITDGTSNVALASANPAGTEQGLLVRAIPLATPLCVTATGAAGSAVTLTLPAVAAQFHYLTSIRIEAYNTAARTGGVAPVLATTTNLPGSLVWTFGSAGAVGTVEGKTEQPCAPLKSSAVNTNTTIVCPATTSVIWRVTVTYYAAP